MRRPRRIRWFAKWAGVVACTLMGVVWLAATQFDFVIGDWPTTGGVRFLDGQMSVAWDTGQQSSWRWGTLDTLRTVGPILWWKTEGYGEVWVMLTVPLWLPFLTLALPTTLLWWLDRRRRIPPNQCRTCGYDLTGNVSGVCPECGQGIA